MEIRKVGVLGCGLMGAGIASQHYTPRAIGAWSGVLSSTTAIFWAWANLARKFPEPPEYRHGEVEVHGEAASR